MMKPSSLFYIPDPCLTETCNSHGTCRSFLDEDFGAYIALCECSAGWGGSKCSLGKI